jgi:hypothetical protein
VLRAAVVADAARRRRGRGAPKVSLSVHLDILEPEI